MHNGEIEKAGDHHFKPETMAFNGKIDSPASLDKKNSCKKENSAGYIKIYEG